MISSNIKGIQNMLADWKAASATGPLRCPLEITNA